MSSSYRGSLQLRHLSPAKKILTVTSGVGAIPLTVWLRLTTPLATERSRNACKTTLMVMMAKVRRLELLMPFGNKYNDVQQAARNGLANSGDKGFEAQEGMSAGGDGSPSSGAPPSQTLQPLSGEDGSPSSGAPPSQSVQPLSLIHI